jgi:hypothetical protein
MERRAAAPILSLERIDFFPFFPLSLFVTNRWQQNMLNHHAFGAKQ